MALFPIYKHTQEWWGESHVIQTGIVPHSCSNTDISASLENSIVSPLHCWDYAQWVAIFCDPHQNLGGPNSLLHHKRGISVTAFVYVEVTWCSEKVPLSTDYNGQVSCCMNKWYLQATFHFSRLSSSCRHRETSSRMTPSFLFWLVEDHVISSTSSVRDPIFSAHKQMFIKCYDFKYRIWKPILLCLVSLWMDKNVQILQEKHISERFLRLLVSASEA